MRQWKYKIETEGKKLRELIDEENCAGIIEQLEVCYKSILNQLNDLDKDDYEDVIDEALSILDGEADTIRNDSDVITDDDGWGFDSIEELVDCRLHEFYNVCDDVRCWVGI